MKARGNAARVFALAGMVAWSGVQAGAAGPPPDLPAIPDKPQAAQFEDVPEPWRTYLVRARVAERLGDPLQRCLAYPDIPGNEWPPGHAQAHCRNHAITTIGIDEIGGYVDRGDIEALESRLDAFLQRHFSVSDFGEDIHYAFAGFSDANPETDRISARWLAQAPDSAYAYLARALFLTDSGWNARGGKWASETPRESIRRMHEFIDQAIPLYERAIELEARLMPAYAGLLDASTAGSRPEHERRAIEQAWALDPACLDMAKMHMRSLQPRWGGSYEKMLALSRELAPHVAGRPHLAVYLGAAYGDRGNRLAAEDQFTREAADVLGIAVSLGSNEDHLRTAAEVAFNREDAPDQWQALAYLLQVTRFRNGSSWVERNIARMLVRMEPEWSLIHAHRALAAGPDDAYVPYVHYLLGAGYYNSHRPDAATRHYTIAMENEPQRQDSLRELAMMWLFHDPDDPAAGAARAAPYIDRLVAEYPDDGLGRLLRIEQVIAIGGPQDMDLYRQFLQRADRSDPRQEHAARQIEAMLQAAGAD